MPVVGLLYLYNFNTGFSFLKMRIHFFGTPCILVYYVVLEFVLPFPPGTLRPHCEDQRVIAI